MTDPIRTERHDDVLVIVSNNPPVNALGAAVRQGLARGIEEALGAAYYRTWADQVVIGELGGRTAREALDAGVAPKAVWAAVWKQLELPSQQR